MKGHEVPNITVRAHKELQKKLPTWRKELQHYHTNVLMKTLNQRWKQQKWNWYKIFSNSSNKT